MRNIMLATTFWGGVTEDEGKRRENELRVNMEFWGGMVEKGSTIVRLESDRTSGIRLLMGFANSKKITLEAQDEMVLQNKAIDDTAAARSVEKETRKIKEEQEAAIQAARVRASQEVAARAAARKAEEERRRQDLARKLEEDRARIQREAREAELRYKREMEEELRAEREYQRQMRREQEREAKILRQELEREKRAYYRNYICQREGSQLPNCDDCGRTLLMSFYRKYLYFL
jgi:hypothetical protein